MGSTDVFYRIVVQQPVKNEFVITTTAPLLYPTGKKLKTELYIILTSVLNLGFFYFSMATDLPTNTTMTMGQRRSTLSDIIYFHLSTQGSLLPRSQWKYVYLKLHGVYIEIWLILLFF